MSIRIDRAVREAIVSNPTGFDLQVTGADDPEAAARALAAARAEVAAIDAGPDSAPGLSAGDRNGVKMAALIRVPGEPGLRIDGGYVPEEILVTIPDLVARHLRAEGVTSARIGLPRTHPIYAIDQTPDAIVARIHVMPPQHKDEPAPVLDPAWIEAAVDWVTQGEADVTLMGQRDRDGLDVSPAQMRTIMEEIGAREVYGRCRFARFDAQGALFGAGLVRGPRWHVVNLAACSGDRPTRVSIVRRLRALVEGLPGVASASLDAKPLLTGALLGNRGPGQHPLSLLVSDHFCPSPGMLNLLGPEHIARFSDLDLIDFVDRDHGWLQLRAPTVGISEEEREEVLEQANRTLRNVVAMAPRGRGPDPVAERVAAMGRWR